MVIMSSKYCSLYRTSLPDVGRQLRQAIDRGCAAAPEDPQIFFRADDIGVPSPNFSRLVASFTRYRLPLCLASVPAWTTRRRLSELRRITGAGRSQWCWHQHGRLHRNFEPTGRKQEFGPARDRRKLRDQLAKGRSRLEALLGEDFTPVFTPPWNRCNDDTLQGLIELNFKAVSRNRNAQPETPSILPDFQVNIDLHTRKEDKPSLALAHILKEIEFGLASGLCGIMIHHQRMNQAAFSFLDMLLAQIQLDRRIYPVHFGDLLL